MRGLRTSRHPFLGSFEPATDVVEPGGPLRIFARARPPRERGLSLGRKSGSVIHHGVHVPAFRSDKPGVRIELTYSDLQSDASPLCHPGTEMFTIVKLHYHLGRPTGYIPPLR
jgi:hypothetical protein